jgi:glycosyltransferase involved in cell wall biosynthesis
LFDRKSISISLKEQFAADLKIGKEDIIFSYLGSIGGWYLTDEMMKFCKMLADKIPAARFLFISPHRHDQIVAAAAKFGVPSEKIITTHAQRPEVPVLLSFSHYSLFFIKPCYSKISSSPTKHGEIMAMGIPVISNAGVGDIKELITKYDAGIVLNDLSENSMHLAIDKIASNPFFDPEKIRHAAEKIYSLELAINAYKKLYDQVLT